VTACDRGTQPHVPIHTPYLRTLTGHQWHVATTVGAGCGPSAARRCGEVTSPSRARPACATMVSWWGGVGAFIDGTRTSAEATGTGGTGPEARGNDS